MSLAALLPPASRPGSEPVAARAVGAVLDCVARVGLAKTTVDDVARAAAMSRATLYRHFSTKQDLTRAAADAERRRIGAAARAAAGCQDDLESAASAIVTSVLAELDAHAALAFLMEHEPQVVLPSICFSGGDDVLAAASRELSPALRRYLGEDAPRAAEWLARVVLSLWLAAERPVRVEDPDEVRAWVRVFVVPGLGREKDDERERLVGSER